MKKSHTDKKPKTNKKPKAKSEAKGEGEEKKKKETKKKKVGNITIMGTSDMIKKFTKDGFIPHVGKGESVTFVMN